MEPRWQVRSQPQQACWWVDSEQIFASSEMLCVLSRWSSPSASRAHRSRSRRTLSAALASVHSPSRSLRSVDSVARSLSETVCSDPQQIINDLKQTDAPLSRLLRSNQRLQLFE